MNGILDRPTAVMKQPRLMFGTQVLDGHRTVIEEAEAILREHQIQIPRNEVGDTFVKLAKIPSPPGREVTEPPVTRALRLDIYIHAYIQNRLKELNIQPYSLDHNALASSDTSAPLLTRPYYLVEPVSQSIYVYYPPTSKDGAFILWDSHMDTVKDNIEDIASEIRVIEEHKNNPITGQPDTIYSTGEIEPYDVRRHATIRDKTVLGADAKTSIAASLHFLKLLQQLDKEAIPHAGALVAITTREELGGVGAAETPLKYLRYGDQYPTLIVVMDHTGFNFNNVYLKGAELVTFDARIKNNNGSQDPVLPVLEFLNGFKVGVRKYQPRLTSNVGAINSNRVPDPKPGMFNSYPEFLDVWCRVTGERPARESYVQQQKNILKREIVDFNKALRRDARERQSKYSPDDIVRLNKEALIFQVQEDDHAHYFHVRIPGVPCHSSTFAQPSNMGVSPLVPLTRFLLALL